MAEIFARVSHVSHGYILKRIFVFGGLKNRRTAQSKVCLEEREGGGAIINEGKL